VWYIQSRFYRAPEVVLDLPYSTPIDLFSLGCMVPELLTGRPLFAGHCEEEQIYRFMEVMGSPPPEVLNRSHRRGMILDSAGRLKKLDLGTS
jgi:dual specificity tyrosine-phosphorylation-regulated kinase 2/3/4